ncbi:MAG: tRNA (adenosine(37)-N6)-threonylcarbamoyltransferase complex transferase subunit TsaD [Bacteroidetes bacterium]|nr:tRNA (adenosine(37)-N6)-threonylcarbamoyltransferase complex transferase subunit TsaD [Bacteroidota bacterium]
MQNLNTYILAIESSCDDTSCAILHNNVVLANVTANQKIHEQYGGVVPELASRDHQKNIVPVVNEALKAANIKTGQLSAIAVTIGPGLMGSLLVGLSFAKSMAMALNIPLIEVNHMQGHILAHFIKEEGVEMPQFPFLCLTVSGGHTQLVKATDHLSFEILGSTIDDAVGEAFDKAAKVMGLPYPGGPLIDKYAKEGDPNKFKFSSSNVSGFDYSFSGIKTSFLYFIQNNSQKDADFVTKNLNDICASYQQHLINVLLKNAKAVLKETGIKHLAIAGGVSANSELRKQIKNLEAELNIKTFIPKFEYCTDNAAMIGIAGYYKFLKNEFSDLNSVPQARMSL